VEGRQRSLAQANDTDCGSIPACGIGLAEITSRPCEFGHRFARPLRGSSQFQSCSAASCYSDRSRGAGDAISDVDLVGVTWQHKWERRGKLGIRFLRECCPHSIARKEAQALRDTIGSQRTWSKSSA
jgi:hypothetical protein